MSGSPDPVFVVESARDNGSVSALRMLAVLLRSRRTVFVSVAIGAVVGLSVALFQKSLYTSSFSFLPQSSQDPRSAGLASLAGQFGISLGALSGSSQPPQLYADLVVTREVLTPIAVDSVSPNPNDRLPLSAFLDVRESSPALALDKTLRVLRKDVISSVVAARTTGMVTVSVRTASPAVSVQIADRLLKGLNDFNLVTRQSQARQERRFTEDRYAAARASLRVAEDALQSFLEANRQFATSPKLTFERDRLQRDVGLQQQVVATLAQQYEDARIREVRDTPVITVIEHPVIAPRPDSRGRALIVLLGIFAGLSAGVLVVLIRDAWTRDGFPANDPAAALLSGEWRRFRGARRLAKPST